MLPTKYGSFGPEVSEDFFLENNQSETRIACGSNVCKRIGTKWVIFREDLL
jgi:carbohydrate-selective porin OprB